MRLMRCHLLIPHALWSTQAESAKLTADLTLPAFSRLAGRGQRESFAALSARDWLGQAFGLDGFPVAPLTLKATGIDAAAAYWLRADPVHLAINQRGAELTDPAALAITPDEASQLIAELNAQFSADGLYFVAATPENWLLRLPEPPDATFTPLASAYGRNISELMPQGREAVRWHRLINEIQMLLYGHSVNDKRAGQGKPLVNSLWLWGGGIYLLPQTLQKPAQRVLGNDRLLATLSELAGVQYTACSDGLSAIDKMDTLAVLDDLTLPALWHDALAWRNGWMALEQNWFVPALAALRAGRFSELIITLPEAGVKIRIERSDLWRFWRRPWTPW